MVFLQVFTTVLYPSSSVIYLPECLTMPTINAITLQLQLYRRSHLYSLPLLHYSSVNRPYNCTCIAILFLDSNNRLHNWGKKLEPSSPFLLLLFLTWMTSMSCLRSSPCLNMIPTGGLAEPCGSTHENSSHKGFFLEAMILHLSSLGKKGRRQEVNLVLLVTHVDIFFQMHG